MLWSFRTGFPALVFSLRLLFDPNSLEMMGLHHFVSFRVLVACGEPASCPGGSLPEPGPSSGIDDLLLFLSLNYPFSSFLFNFECRNCELGGYSLRQGLMELLSDK